jgi:hypothetical protein
MIALFSVIALVFVPVVFSVLGDSISQFRNPKTTGTVVEVLAKNVYGQKRLVGAKGERMQKLESEVELTQFVAVIAYSDLLGKEFKVELSSGEVLGHNQPPNMSKHKLGEEVPLSYSQYRPAEAKLYDPASAIQTFFFVLAFTLFWVILAFAIKTGRKKLFSYLFGGYLILFAGGYIVLIPGCDKESYIVTRDSGMKQIYNEHAEK